MLNLKAKGYRPWTGRSTPLGQHRAKERGGQSGVLRVWGEGGAEKQEGTGCGATCKILHGILSATVATGMF